MIDENVGSFFNAVVRDAISDIKKNNSAVVFNFDQVKAVKAALPDIEVKEDDGFYYLRRNIDES